MHRLTLILAALSLPSSAATAQPLPFEGKWALRAEWCQPGPTTPPDQPRPAVLTARGLVTGEMTCTFTSVLPGGVSYRVEADCAAGTERGHEFFGFAVLSGMLHWSWGKQTGSFVRCQ